MTPFAAKNFAPELLELYGNYAHVRSTTREFLDRTNRCTIGEMTAMALLGIMSPDYALAEQVSFTDLDIVADYFTYASPAGDGTVRAYQVH